MTLPGANHGGKASVHALVLAAGQGSRFGGAKLHAAYRGRPLLAHALAQVGAARAADLIDGVHVVIAEHDHQALELVCAARLPVIVNDAPHLGLSRSLRLGLETLQDLEKPEAAMVFLGDQPHVRLDVIERLVAEWHGGRGTIVRPRYEAHPDVPGHPVLLSRAVWPLVKRLTGDSGFGALPAAQDDTVLVDVAGDNPDVDTPAELEALLIDLPPGAPPEGSAEGRRGRSGPDELPPATGRRHRR